ncbi:MAG: metal ABC transporter permease, partial [Thermoprotei archaeon]
GEKARIALAAALIRNPRILVLDEPTAMLDSLTEDRVMEALERATENRTTIIIAHRLSTLKFADKIVVMDGGKIVEQGSHKQLLERGGLYAKLWSSQLKALTRREAIALDRWH